MAGGERERDPVTTAIGSKRVFQQSKDEGRLCWCEQETGSGFGVVTWLCSGLCIFTVAAPTEWNKLPQAIKTTVAEW